jgi:hypothetical protein
LTFVSLAMLANAPRVCSMSYPPTSADQRVSGSEKNVAATRVPTTSSGWSSNDPSTISRCSGSIVDAISASDCRANSRCGSSCTTRAKCRAAER